MMIIIGQIFLQSCRIPQAHGRPSKHIFFICSKGPDIRAVVCRNASWCACVGTCNFPKASWLVRRLYVGWSNGGARVPPRCHSTWTNASRKILPVVIFQVPATDDMWLQFWFWTFVQIQSFHCACACFHLTLSWSTEGLKLSMRESCWVHSCWHVPHTMRGFGLRGGSAKSSFSQNWLRICSTLPLSWTAYQVHVPNTECKSWLQVWNHDVPCNCGDCRTVCHGCWPPGEFVSAKFVPPWLRNLCLWRPRCSQIRYFVKKASAGTEGVGQTQLCITTRLPAFFALSSRFAVRTCWQRWQTMQMFQTFPHFSIYWSCKQGMRLYFCCEVLDVKSQAHDNPRFYWIARQNPGR